MIDFRVEWTDDHHNWLEKPRIQEKMIMPFLKPEDENWRKDFLKILKENHPVVRIDAIIENLNIQENE